MESNKVELYRKYHENPGNYPGISVMKHLPVIAALVQEIKPKTVLDYGCGKGRQYHQRKIHEFLKMPMPTLYDIGVPEYSTVPEGLFELVLSTGVMEHVPEEYVMPTLIEIFSLASKAVFLSISTKPALLRLPNGENAHCTVKSEKWWCRRIELTRPFNLKVVLATFHSPIVHKFEVDEKIRLYQKFHEKQDHYPGRALLKHRKAVRDLLIDSDSKTIIDFGCGKAGHWLKHKVHEAWGIPMPVLYDPALPEYCKVPKEPADMVVCMDVLEHVPEERLDATLKQIFHLATKAVFFGIATEKAPAILETGENAHCTLHDPEWWRCKINTLRPSHLLVRTAFDTRKS